METQEITLHNELKHKSIFLRDYTTELYASGATTIRIEKNLGRIAEQWDTKADFSVLPTCIVLNLWDKKEEKSYSLEVQSLTTVRSRISQVKQIFQIIFTGKLSL